MLKRLFLSEPENPSRGLAFIRVALALVLLVHPLSRLVKGHVPDFGAWLSSQGFVMGTAAAYTITLLECCSGLALLARRWVLLGCLGFITVLTGGIVMVHGREGWFVVGGGRNGVEYSVMLIACLVGLILAHLPKRTAQLA